MNSIKLFALLIFLLGSVAHANMYRWVDGNGKVHFSDKVPPAVSQKGHTSLGKNGVEAAKVSSSAELKSKQEEEVKKTELVAGMTDAKKAEVEKNIKDKKLLASYQSRDELIAVYKKKISIIDQSLGILNARDESLAAKLAYLDQKYKKAKAELSRSSLSEDIRNAQAKLSGYQKTIAVSRADKEELMDEYRQNLIRFDHLTLASQ